MKTLKNHLNINSVWSTVRSLLLANGISSSNALNAAVARNLRGDYSLGEFSDPVLLKIQQQVIYRIKRLIEYETKLELNEQQYAAACTPSQTKTSASPSDTLESAPHAVDYVEVTPHKGNRLSKSTRHTSCLSSQRNTRPGNCSISDRLCVAITTAVPFFAISCKWLTICSLVEGSRLPVGSSARMRRGLLSNARAITMRCCSPPDSS